MTAVRKAATWLFPALLFFVASASPVAADNLGYCPADTEFILSIHIQRMLESKLAKENKQGLELLKGMLKQNDQAEMYLKELGFDLFRDLESVTLIGPASADQARFLALIGGRFDPKKFAATAEKAARDNGDVLKITRAGKHQIIEITLPGKNETYFVALADSKTLLASQTKAIVTDALAKAGTDKEPPFKKEVRDLLASRAKDASASFVATCPAVSKLLAASPDPKVALVAKGLENLLQQIDGFNGSITLAADIQFQLGIGTKDADTAKTFAQQAPVGLLIVRGLLAKQAKDDPKVAAVLPVLNTLTASSQGNTFIIRGRVPPEVLEKALKGALNP
jgi:hypothetical protein